MTQAKLDAWFSLGVGPMQHQIIILLHKTSPLTIYDIAWSMDVPVHRVSGRVSELYQAGRIVEDGHQVNESTGRKVTLWKLS